MMPSQEFKQSHALKFDNEDEETDDEVVSDVLLKDVDRDKYDLYVNRISKITKEQKSSPKVKITKNNHFVGVIF
jgi:hypothetical protein